MRKFAARKQGGKRLRRNKKDLAVTAKSFRLTNGEPWRARTSDPLIKSALKCSPVGHGSYDLLTFVTGCSRQQVHLLLPINASLSVFWSQVGHNGTSFY